LPVLLDDRGVAARLVQDRAQGVLVDAVGRQPLRGPRRRGAGEGALESGEVAFGDGLRGLVEAQLVLATGIVGLCGQFRIAHCLELLTQHFELRIARDRGFDVVEPGRQRAGNHGPRVPVELAHPLDDVRLDRRAVPEGAELDDHLQAQLDGCRVVDVDPPDCVPEVAQRLVRTRARA
jgi:hypothetical protein